MKAIISLICFYSITLYSQVTEFDDLFLSPVNDYYSTNYLSGMYGGRGNTGIAGENDLSGIFLNPASLKTEKKFQVNLQYSYKTNQRFTYIFTEYDYSSIYKPLPLTISIGMSYKVNNHLYAGFIYNNPNNVKYDYPDLSTPTDEKYYYETQIHSFNIPVVYKFGIISAGLILNLNHYLTQAYGVSYPNEPEAIKIASTWVWRFNAQAGIIYSPNKHFSAGATFTPGFKTDVQGVKTISPDYKFVSRYPMKLAIGLSYHIPKSVLKFCIDYNFQKLSEISGFKDKHDFNFGAEYFVNKSLTLRGGFFTFFDVRDLDVSGYNKYDQYFITLGFTYRLKNFDASLSFLDSHFSSGIVKNTYLNTSLSYNF